MLRTSCSRAITYLANPSELPSWHRRGGCAAGADGVVGQVPKQFLTKSPNSGCQSTRENSMLYLTYHPGASRHPSCARRGVRSDLPSMLLPWNRRGGSQVEISPNDSYHPPSLDVG